MTSHLPKTEIADMQAVVDGRARLSTQEAMRLYNEASLHDLGQWADAMARRIHGPAIRTYVIDRNINYTNVCSANCTFCAFKRDLGEADAYVLSRDQLHGKIQELSDIGGTQILLQGGMHPELELSWYENMLREMKAAFGHIHLHAFSPPEFVEFVAVCKLDGFPVTAPGEGDSMPRPVWLQKLRLIMQRLMAAGLDSLPGGGGEIFAPHVRRRIGPGKASAEQWLDVMRTAHQLGMNTSATMMFGHIEGIADRIDHMHRYRMAQDEAIAKGFPGRYMAFIAWPFQPDNTPLGRLTPHDPESGEIFPGDELAEAVMLGAVDGLDKAGCAAAVPLAGKRLRLSSAVDYLRTQALSRLFLDNIHSIGSSWVTMGPKIGQIGLMFGASDMGSVMMEENVVSAAGTTYCLNEATICRLIRDAGFIPAQRDNHYNVLRIHEDGPYAPDRAVTDWSTLRPAHSAFVKTEPAAAGVAAAVDLTVAQSGGQAD